MKNPHRDDRTTKHLIVDGWNEFIYQNVINERIASMPARL